MHRQDVLRCFRFRPSTKTKEFFVRLTSGDKIMNVTKESDQLQRDFGLFCICSSNARHVLETLKGSAGLNATENAGVSKYLRHSESVAATHYDFSAVEQSARNRETIVNLLKGMPK